MWLVCTNSFSTTSRMIPTWRQHIFTGTENECIKFFVNVEFDGDLWGWIDDHILEQGDEAVAKEIKSRWKDFGSFDFPYGYTEVPKGERVSNLWDPSRIMWGMDQYVPKIN